MRQINIDMRNSLYFTLIALNALSVLLILQIVFNLIPLWNCTFSDEQVGQINGLIIDIAIGINLSSFFYYLLVYIPESRKRKIVRKVNYADLRAIANSMQLIIGYVAKRCSLEVKGDFYEVIKKEDFEKIEDLDIGDGINYCESKVKIRDFELNDKIFIDSSYLQIDRDKVIESIHRIISSPNIIYDDENLVFLLYQIEKSMFLLYISSLKDSKVNPFAKNVIYEYYKLYTSLLKYVTPYSCEFIKVSKWSH